MASLLVIRYLLVSNGILITVIGFICLLWVERPAGFLIAGAAWLASGLLFGAVPYTDPYRHERLEPRDRRKPRSS